MVPENEQFTTFFLTATSGSLEPAGDGSYTLALQGVPASTLWLQQVSAGPRRTPCSFRRAAS